MNNISVYLQNFNKEPYEAKSEYLIVNSCGLFRVFTKDLNVIREHGRLDYQIIYICEGTGYFYIGNTIRKISKGNIILYRPGEIQKYYYLSSDSPVVFWVHFDGYGVDALLEDLGFTKEKIFFVDYNSNYATLFENIVYELQLKRYAFTKTSSSYLSELLCLMARNSFEARNFTNKLNREKIYKIIETIHTDYNKKHSLNNFAKYCNMSISWFINCFKEITGMPPLEYVTKVKIDKAKELLSNSNYNISEVANLVGYDNPLYFSRIFKKVTGISPSIFIKNSK